MLLKFYGCPAEIHLRTTTGRVDLCHSAPASARHKGLVSRPAGIAMAFKLIDSGQARWRAVSGASCDLLMAPYLVARVRAGARFEKGKLVERPGESRRFAGFDEQLMPDVG